MDHETSTFLREWMDSRRRRVPSGSPVPSSSEASATQAKKCCGGHSKPSKSSKSSKPSKHSDKNIPIAKPITAPIGTTGQGENKGDKPTWAYLLIFGALAGCGWKGYTYYYTVFPTDKAKQDARTELIWVTVAAVIVSLYVYRNFLSERK